MKDGVVFLRDQCKDLSIGILQFRTPIKFPFGAIQKSSIFWMKSQDLRLAKFPGQGILYGVRELIDFKMQSSHAFLFSKILYQKNRSDTPISARTQTPAGLLDRLRG